MPFKPLGLLHACLVAIHANVGWPGVIGCQASQAYVMLVALACLPGMSCMIWIDTLLLECCQALGLLAHSIAGHGEWLLQCLI